jgi:hypothetical protein
MGRWPWATLCGIALLACSSVTPPADIPVTEASLDEAAAVVRETAARNPNFQLVEGGISVEAYQWIWRDHTVVDPVIVGSIVVPGAPRVVHERELVGPAPYYVPFREVAGVAVRRWAIGVGIELSVDGTAEPLFIQMKDAETAQRLADALDVLRRARHNETPEENGPLQPSAGE